MRLTLTALAGLLALTACNNPVTPESTSRRVLVQGVVRDSSGTPILGARVQIAFRSATDTTAYLQSLVAHPQIIHQTDEQGAYQVAFDSVPDYGDSLLVRIRSPNCSDARIVRMLGTRPRTNQDSVYLVDFTFPLPSPRPTPQDQFLCAFDLHPVHTSLTFLTFLKIDSTQTIVSPASTLFRGSWDHHTSGSVIGDTGTFVGVVTATSVVIDLTYSTPGPVCGPTQRLAAPVLPDGRWGMVLNAGDPACPVATLPLAFAPYPMP